MARDPDPPLGAARPLGTVIETLMKDVFAPHAPAR